ncbi:MAG TPA: ATPase [Methanocella sp.]|nr:ATPase [Methanocella sp.]
MHRYFLGLPGLDDATGGIADGTNVMLIGPPMCGKRALLDGIMASGIQSHEAVILVDARGPGRDALERLKPPEGAPVGVVDCISRTLGAAVSDTARVKHMSSPVDLTGVSVRVDSLAEELGPAGDGHIRLCIDSLSTILMYSNLQAVFRFMHVVAGQVALRRNLGVYVVDEHMHDPQTIATLKQLFNAVLQVKVEDDRSFVRATGLTPRPTPWFEYEVVDHAVLMGGPRRD